MNDVDELSAAQQRMLDELRAERTVTVTGKTRRTAQALVDAGFAEPVRVDGGELTGIRMPESLVAAPAEATTPTPDPEPEPERESSSGPQAPHAGMRFAPVTDGDATWRVTSVTGDRVYVRYSDDDGPAQGFARRSWFTDHLVSAYR